MDRLTIPDEPIEGGMRREVIDARAVRGQAMTMYWRLKKYEDICSDPERLKLVDGCYLDMCRELTELREQLVSKWIPAAERLPDEGVNPITGDAYVYPVTIDLGNVRDIRYYSFCRGHWYNQGPGEMDDLVVAWMPRPESYRPD